MTKRTSLYDPNALPFWEIDKGNGPITKQRELVEVRRNKRREESRTVYKDVGYTNTMPGSLGDGNRWVSRRG